MPYVFTTSLIPPNKGVESSKKYIEEIKKVRAAERALAKEIIPNAVKATEDGIEVISVSEPKEGKLEEFLLLQQKNMVAYHDIEGFRYKIEVRFKAVEALEMIGMKLPE